MLSVTVVASTTPEDEFFKLIKVTRMPAKSLSPVPLLSISSLTFPEMEPSTDPILGFDEVSFEPGLDVAGIGFNVGATLAGLPVPAFGS